MTAALARAVPPQETSRPPLEFPRAAVAATDLTKRFGRLPVLRGLTFAVKPGRVTALAGPNGAGKSTLIKAMLGLVRPDGGTLAVDGVPVGEDPSYRAAHRLHAAAGPISRRISPGASW